MKRCTSCIIPETYPGIEFNSKGICSLCRQTDEKDRFLSSVHKMRRELEKIISEVKARNEKYDALVAFSGGKDSTFLIHILKR